MRIWCHCSNIKHRWASFIQRAHGVAPSPFFSMTIYKIISPVPSARLLLRCLASLHSHTVSTPGLARVWSATTVRRKRIFSLFSCGRMLLKKPKRFSRWTTELLSVRSLCGASKKSPMKRKVGLLWSSSAIEGQSSSPPAASSGGEETSVGVANLSVILFPIPRPCFSSPAPE